MERKLLQNTHNSYLSIYLLNSLLVQTFPSRYAFISLKKKESLLPAYHISIPCMHTMNFFLSFLEQLSKGVIPFIPCVNQAFFLTLHWEREKKQQESLLAALRKEAEQDNQDNRDEEPPGSAE